ncbi:MAG: hypothetical protein V1861_03695 [Candidatus Micrarchaeota archaeon]
MRFFLILAIVLSLIVAGCCGQTLPSPAPGGSGQAAGAGAANQTSGGGNGTATGQPSQPVTGDGTIIDATGGAGNGSVSGGATAGQPATSQQDCATLSQNCGICTAKANCGWCKSTNACYFGDVDGPAGDITCPSNEWTVTESGCLLASGGKTCESQTNCAFCLSGTGCQWCIQGSKCAPSGTSEQCFGGWLTQSFQCNFASR